MLYVASSLEFQHQFAGTVSSKRVSGPQTAFALMQSALSKLATALLFPCTSTVARLASMPCTVSERNLELPKAYREEEGSPI